MKSLFLVVLLLQIVLGFDPSTYPNKVVFSASYTLYWKLNGEKIQFGLVVNTVGWIGFGVGEKESGSMPGGDIAVISYSGNKPIITDHYAMGFAHPSVDSCQNWVLLSHSIQGGVTWVEIERELDTGDTQDRLIEGGTMMLIYAYGLSTETTLAYHDSRRGIYGVEFWPSPVAQPFPTDANLQTLTNTMDDFKVPTRTTTYACIAHKVPVDRFEDDYHIVRVEPHLDPRTSSVTHHMLVHQCILNSPVAWAALYLNRAAQCLSPIGMPFSGCNTLLYGWAMGIGPMNMPPEAGARMGYSKQAFQYIVTEMHYDNPNGIRGLLDNSGYKMYYTNRRRKFDVSTITSGDPYISFPSIPPKQASFGLEATCPSQCTEKFKDDIHIFASSHHMHVTGVQMWTTHYRNDEYIGTIGRTEFFAFDNQHSIYVNVTLKRGDRLNTHCVFNTEDRSRSTGFGYSSLSEMCMDFLQYYPRQEFGLGGADFAYCGYFGWFGAPETLCGSNQGFLTTASIMSVKNPIASDMAQTREIVFGQEPARCSKRNF